MKSNAAETPIRRERLQILPFGNGAERIFENRHVGAQLHHLNFNRHQRAHLLRAAQEGIVFSLSYGVQILAEMGLATDTVRAGHSNSVLSRVFGEAFVTLRAAQLELYDTDVG